MNNVTRILQEAENISNISENLFEVKKIQLHPNIEGFNSPSSFGMYRNTGGDALGVVGSSFEATQPKFLFDNFVESLQNFENCDLNKLTYTELKGGSRVLFKAPIGSISFKNMAGKDDVMDLHVNLQTGFDGQTKTSMYISSYRMICSNGMKAHTTEFSTSFKNTKGNVGKANLMVNDLEKSFKLATNFKEMVKELDSKQISSSDVDDFIFKVTGLRQKEYNDMSTRSRNILDNINRSIGIEFSDTGSTAWGLVNGITRYTNHMASASNRTDFLFADSGMALNDKAQKFALQLLN